MATRSLLHSGLFVPPTFSAQTRTPVVKVCQRCLPSYSKCTFLAGSRQIQQSGRSWHRSAGVSMIAAPWPGVGRRHREDDWEFDPLGLKISALKGTREDLAVDYFQQISGKGPNRPPPGGASSPGGGRPVMGGPEDNKFGVGDFFGGKLPGKMLEILGLLAFTRIGVYLPLPGVNADAFSSSFQQGGLSSLFDTLSGGGIGRVGVFSLGIVPYINAQIVFQLLTSVFPRLAQLQKKEGEAGRRQFESYTRWASLALALAQATGQVLFLKPYAYHDDSGWFATSVLVLTAGAMVEVYIAEYLSKLKLGNGTSLLIFTNIVSYLPASIGKTVADASGDGNWLGLAAILGAFVFLIGGIVYVQDAERKIPMNYARRYSGRGPTTRTYLPFKVNATGVMPVIFSSSLLAAPASLAQTTGIDALKALAVALYPGGPAYLPANVALIAFFNYFYTFLQLEPDEVSDQLKRQGASIEGIRPGKATAAYLTGVLTRMSVLGSGFLGALAAAPGLVETATGLTAFRGFAGTSVLILVGVATDFTRKVQAELVSQKYLTISTDRFDSGSGPR